MASYSWALSISSPSTTSMLRVKNEFLFYSFGLRKKIFVIWIFWIWTWVWRGLTPAWSLFKKLIRERHRIELLARALKNRGPVLYLSKFLALVLKLWNLSHLARIVWHQIWICIWNHTVLILAGRKYVTILYIRIRDHLVNLTMLEGDSRRLPRGFSQLARGLIL